MAYTETFLLFQSGNTFFNEFCSISFLRILSGNNDIDEMAFRNMEKGGVNLPTTNALLAELAFNWVSEDGQKIMQVLAEEILSLG